MRKMSSKQIKQRLEYLRGELRAERISYGELAELQSLVPHIEPGDLELLEAAGVPEEEAMKHRQTPKGKKAKKKAKTFVQVEYDPNYTGGDYDGVGQFVLVPTGVKSIEQAFERMTGLNRKHIVHYCPDELYDKDGEFWTP